MLLSSAAALGLAELQGEEETLGEQSRNHPVGSSPGPRASPEKRQHLLLIPQDILGQLDEHRRQLWGSLQFSGSSCHPAWHMQDVGVNVSPSAHPCQHFYILQRRWGTLPCCQGGLWQSLAGQHSAVSVQDPAGPCRAPSCAVPRAVG